MEKWKFMGSYGLNNSNKKIVETINMMKMHHCNVPMILLQHRNNITWRSFNETRSPFQIDQWITKTLDLILECKVINYWISSDYSAIIILLKFQTIKKPIFKDINTIS